MHMNNIYTELLQGNCSNFTQLKKKEFTCLLKPQPQDYAYLALNDLFNPFSSIVCQGLHSQ